MIFPPVLLATAAVQHLLDRGVAEWVICAGARNAAFVVLLAELQQRGVRVWHHFEERCAGFFALGRARILERPVAVVTTSGTAAAELLPAVVEAHYQGLPLVLVTADRPRHFRGSGAPQAIEQVNLFGPYAECQDVAAADDLQSAENVRISAPLQLNVCLEEPAAADIAELRQQCVRIPLPAEPRRAVLPAGATEDVRNILAGARNPLLLLGDLLDSEIPAAIALAESCTAPIWAEAASGLREHPALAARLIRGGDAALAQNWDAVLRIGGVPSCRLWRDLETQPAVPVFSLHRTAHRGLGRTENVRHHIWDYAQVPAPPTAGEPDDAQRRTDSPPATGPGISSDADLESRLVHALSLLIPAGSLVFTGNSLPVREWNAAATVTYRGLRVHTLRGANGIDGNLSAWLGLGADVPESWAIVGDLTALYDLAAPWILAQLPAARRRIVVLNNGGGRIFSRLPSLRPLQPGERSLMENPHTLSLAPVAALWGMDYRCLTSLEQDAAGSCPVLEGLADNALIELRC